MVHKRTLELDIEALEDVLDKEPRMLGHKHTLGQVDLATVGMEMLRARRDWAYEVQEVCDPERMRRILAALKELT